MKSLTRIIVKSLKNPLVQRLLVWVVPIIISRVVKRYSGSNVRKK